MMCSEMIGERKEQEVSDWYNDEIRDTKEKRNKNIFHRTAHYILRKYTGEPIVL